MKRRIINTIVALMAMATASNAQQLSVSEVKAEAGAQSEITVNLTGATDKTALQYNLSLPAGLALAESTGDYGIKLGNATKGHTLSVSPLASGDLLIVLYSMYQDTFADGTLMTIPVVATGENGTTSGSLNTIRTATADAVSSECADVAFSATVGPFTINDGEDVALTNGEEYASVAYNRTLEAGKYGTIVLPFAPDASVTDNYAFYELTSNDSKTLTFNKVATPVACKPYLYKQTGTESTAITGTGVTLSTTVVPTTAGEWTMTGTFEKQTISCTGAEAYYYAYSAAGNEINRVTQTLTANPFRAYFTTAASSAAKQMRIVVSDETTGIKENYELEIMNTDGAVYDLQGRKVKNPGKGLYIVNGKKVVKD